MNDTARLFRVEAFAVRPSPYETMNPEITDRQLVAMNPDAIASFVYCQHPSMYEVRMVNGDTWWLVDTTANRAAMELTVREVTTTDRG